MNVNINSTNACCADNARLLVHIVATRSIHIRPHKTVWSDEKSAREKAHNFKCSAIHEIERRNPCCCHYGPMNSVRALSLAILSVHSFPNWLKLDLLDLRYRKLKWFLISDKMYGHWETFRRKCELNRLRTSRIEERVCCIWMKSILSHHFVTSFFYWRNTKISSKNNFEKEKNQ